MTTEEINELFDEWQDDIQIREKHIRLMFDMECDTELDTLLDSLKDKQVDWEQ